MTFGLESLNGFKKSAVLFIHFFVVEPILLKLDFDFDFVFDLDHDGSLNIEEPLDFALVVEAP